MRQSHAIHLFVDAVSIVAALFAGFVLAFPDEPASNFVTRQWKLVLFSEVVYLSLNSVFGVYRNTLRSSLRFQLPLLLKSYLLGTTVIFATLFLFRNTYYVQGVAVTYLLSFPSLLIIFRTLLNYTYYSAHSRGLGTVNAAAICLDHDAERVLAQLKRGVAGLRIRQMKASTNNVASIQESIGERNPAVIFLVGGSLASVSSARKKHQVLDLPVRLLTPEIHAVLSQVAGYDYSGIEAGVVPVDGNVKRTLKRTVDVVGSLLLIILFIPVWTLVAVLLKMSGEKSVFFRQQRSLAADQEPINVIKFRTMNENGSKEAGEPGLEDQGEILSKRRDDPRVTAIGRVLRKFSVDELPQLVNVLKGEMSLVGPRPLPVEDYRRLEKDDPAVAMSSWRSQAKPGLTGLWQVTGRSGVSFRDMVILDLYYVEQNSFWFDLSILFKTIPAVISGRDAY